MIITMVRHNADVRRRRVKLRKAMSDLQEVGFSVNFNIGFCKGFPLLTGSFFILIKRTNALYKKN